MANRRLPAQNELPSCHNQQLFSIFTAYLEHKTCQNESYITSAPLRFFVTVTQSPYFLKSRVSLPERQSNFQHHASSCHNTQVCTLVRMTERRVLGTWPSAAASSSWVEGEACTLEGVASSWVGEVAPGSR